MTSTPGHPSDRRAAARRRAVLVVLGFALRLCLPAPAGVIHEVHSPYHHILVVDEDGIRTLSFDGTQETRMSLKDPLLGHFGYTELFHFAWLWNTNISRVAMLGLGGGSTQRSFLHRYPDVRVDSVEIDPAVVRIATNFFHVPVHERHRVVVEDGRNFLRRSREKYDLIVMDAYVKHRYGSHMPPHLATREFFEIVRERLTEQGVVAYNVITVVRLGNSDATRALARTLLQVFPQVYAFPAADSLNTVLIATRDRVRLTPPELRRRAAQVRALGRQPPPGLFERLPSIRTDLPAGVHQARILTDDYAPVEALERR
ncbi:MAG: fused MFS/spermidine synthase [Verrucomicrobiales bacterium]|nr:fused MFS/spermidine synthase [Verrucomicrobiales bacterium]